MNGSFLQRESIEASVLSAVMSICLACSSSGMKVGKLNTLPMVLGLEFAPVEIDEVVGCCTIALKARMCGKRQKIELCTPSKSGDQVVRIVDSVIVGKSW